MKNTFVKVLSFMMALTMIVGAFGAITVSAAACAHENRTETAVVAPTCATAGFTSYKCNDCGETFIDGVKSATGNHTWKDVPASKATCDENGYAAHKVCTTCPAENPATDPADLSTIIIETKLDHVWNIPYTQAATCSEAGFTSLKCARCAAISEDPAHYTELAKIPHDYQYAVTAAPTNCVSGKITVTCSACDYENVIENKNTHVWKNMDLSTKADGTEFKAEVVKALGEIGKEFGDTCGDDYKKGEICIVCYETRDTEASSGTCATFTVVGAADGFKVTAKNYKPEFATVDGKTFAVGSVTKVDPTHVAAGWQLIFCEDCATYDVMTLEKEDHDYTGTGSSVIWKDAQGNKYPNTASTGVKAYDDKEYHTIAMTKYNVCSCGAEKAATGTGSTKASSNHNYNWEEGGQKGKVVVAADCVNNGTITWNCKECVGGDYVELNGVALGHTYGEWSYVDSYTCGDASADGQMVRSCTRKYGNNACALDGCKDYKKADANKTHAYAASIKTAATCVANAVYEWKCSDCGDVNDAAKPADVTYPVSGFNASNHVVTTAATPVEENVVKASCTNKAKNRYLCTCGQLVDLEVGATPAHTEGTVYHVAECGKAANAAIDASCKAGCKSVAVKGATCQAAGIKTAGKICTTCGTVTKDPEVDPINPKKHAADPAAAGASTAPANCISGATRTDYYSCCGKVDTIVTDETKAPNNHTNLTFVAKVPATCVATGTAAHYVCEGCKKVVVATHDGSGETKDDYTPGALDANNTADTLNKLATNGQHDFTGTTENVYKFPAKAETCTAKGSVAYTKCKNAGCTYIKVDGKDPFVPSDGNDADTIYDQIEVAPHGTTNMGWHKGVEPTCTVDGYKFKDANGTYSYDLTYCCSKCDRLTVVKTNHANSDSEVINSKTGGKYDCTMPTYEFHVCLDCGYSFFKNYVAATKTAHTFTKYTDGDKKGQDKPDDEGTPTCTKAAQDTYECTECDYSETRPGAAALGHKIKVNGIEIAVDFGCTSEDHKTYQGFKCACGAELGVEAKYEHNIAHAAPKAPTCTTSGNEEFDFCVDCGKLFVEAGVDVTKLEKPALGHSAASTLISTENGIETLSCPVCGEFWTKAVDVVDVETLSANKIAAGEVVTYTFAANGKVEFNAETVEVYYNATMLTFVGVEANADLAGLYAFASVNAGSIGVALVVENDAEGNAQNVVTPVDGTTVLFTLTFVANKTASGNVAIGANPVASERPVVEIAPVGNLNGDAVVTAADAQAIFSKIGSNDAAADVNNDGIVNFADVAALATFAASNKTAKDYLVMVGEYDAIEAEVYALLDAGRLANHDTVTNVINVNDALALIAEIETGLAGAYATLGNNVTAAAVVAYYNAK